LAVGAPRDQRHNTKRRASGNDDSRLSLSIGRQCVQPSTQALMIVNPRPRSAAIQIRHEKSPRGPKMAARLRKRKASGQALLGFHGAPRDRRRKAQ
jgi:hypothetical protein